MGDTVSVRCLDCEVEYRYTLTSDGRILHGCPDCESGRVTIVE